MDNRIQILFLTAEADPLVKIGGLGDVSGSLPVALQALPESPDVRLVLPLYPQIESADLNLQPVASFSFAHSHGSILTNIFQTRINGIITYLVNGAPVIESPAVYSGDAYQDGRKFVFLSLAAMKLVKILSWKPDILHAHDWHTAPAVYNLRLIREQDEFYQNTKSLLTVHNLPFLGYDTEVVLQAFGLPRAHMSALPEWAEHLPLPLGLLTADKINTVSPGYAKEILTPEFGANLEKFLQTRKDDLSGILNGLDIDAWNPETDPNIPVRYTIKSLTRRKENKIQLLKELRLEPDLDKPLLAMINRMDFQKGVDLVPDALELIADMDWQVIILGTGDLQLEESTRQLEIDYPQVRTVLRFDGGLARRIYSGSDLILIPSRYEPSGLTQMIGMRYGCVPLARATGGLKDTIQDYHHGKTNQSTGFLFKEPTSQALAETIRRALLIYKDQRRWQGLQRRGMKIDFSWERSARKYMDLYSETLSK